MALPLTHHDVPHLHQVPTVTAMTDRCAIEITDLHKQYGTINAVDHISLKVHEGEVYGFLGPNGAGKTTTLRMLLGLIQPTSGHISLMGLAPGTPESLAHIGAMIETPSFYPFLSGRENLHLLATYSGTPESRIDQVLAQVDLASRGNDPFRAYSLGMKQRLGVAAALLKNPPLLMLDEPTNGLDPAGMADMRDLIRDLGRAGHTVLLSSHLMHEVEQVCDRVGVIARGRIVAEGRVDDLRGRTTVVIRTDSPERATQVLLPLVGQANLHLDRGAFRIETTGSRPIAIATLNRALVEAGIAVHELRTDRRSLEDVFLTLTGGTHDA